MEVGMGTAAGEKLPLRRRRHVGGGNPNEPDEGESESSGINATVAATMGRSLPPLNRGNFGDGAYELDAGEQKVHGSSQSSLPLLLQKTLSLGAHGFGGGVISSGYEQVVVPSLSPPLPDGSQTDSHRQIARRREKNAHALSRHKLNELEALIESRDWSAVTSHLNLTGDTTSDARIRESASRLSNAPAFYDRQYGTTLLPLHRACMYDPTPRAVEALVSANPEGPTVPESAFGRLPLHMACRSDASIGAVRALLRSHRGAAACRDRLGRIPLHYCLANGANFNVVVALVDAYGDGMSVPDEEGWLPLHVACGVGVSRPVIKALLRAEPRAVLARTRRGSSPLDCARLFIGGRYADGIATLFGRTMDERRYCVVVEEDEEEKEQEGVWVGSAIEGR